MAPPMQSSRQRQTLRVQNHDRPLLFTRHAARLARQKRLDGGPFIIGEFVAHNSRLRFGSLNHAPSDAINPQRPIAADANALILLPLSGAQPTWRDLLVASSVLKNDPSRTLGLIKNLRPVFIPFLTRRTAAKCYALGIRQIVF